MIIMERGRKRERQKETKFLRAGQVYERNSEPALGPIFAS